MHPIAVVARVVMGLYAARRGVPNPNSNSALQLPSQDAFYVQPANISDYNLGDVIRYRNVTDDVAGLNQNLVLLNIKSAFQFLYRTNDSLANPVGAVATFLTPNSKNSNSSRLLAYSIAYDSANNDCSPSYAFRRGANNTVGSDMNVISTSLNNGWYVVTSDYEGLNAQMVAGIQAGHSVLDSIKMSLTDQARSLTGLSADAEYGMFGYSGGAIAAEWASEMAPTYAPSLTKFIGAAIGGLTPNITSVLEFVNGGVASGLIFSGAAGMARAYPNMSEFIYSNILPSHNQTFNNLAKKCSPSAEYFGALENIYEFFQAGRRLMYNPVMATVFSGAGQMGVHGTPQMPLYVYKAVFDEVSPINDTTTLVEKFCDEGVPVTYHVNFFGEHITEGFIGTPAALQFLKDRWDGVKLASGCNFLQSNLSQVASAGDAFATDELDALASALNTTIAIPYIATAVQGALTAALAGVTSGIGL